jgi:4-carboxymuconolactone decarboxylase
MPRIPLITRPDELPVAHREVWTRIAKRRGNVVGPFAALLHSPVLADRTAELGAYIRFDSMLSAVDRELVILTVARVLDCRFEWAYHVREARKAGVRTEAIAAIRERRAPAGLTEEEASVVGYVRQLLVDHTADEGTLAALRARLGVQGVVELTATAGYYAMLACTLNAFDVRPGPGEEELDVP